MRLEYFVKSLLHQRGLYILGAGASSPIIPIGGSLINECANHYWNGGSFPTTIPHQDERTLETRDRASKTQLELTESGNYFYNDIIKLMPSRFVQYYQFHRIAKPAFYKVAPDNYAVFKHFPSSLILNYNLDGLAGRICRPRHKVIAPHGTVPARFGAPDMQSHIESAQMYDLSATPTNHILFEREPDCFYKYLSGLHYPNIPFHVHCSFVVLIGYTFGQNRGEFDDHHSFDYLCNLLRKYPKPVFIVDPSPDFIAECLSEKIKSNDVHPVPIYWDIFSKVLIEIIGNGVNVANVSYKYNMLLNAK